MCECVQELGEESAGETERMHSEANRQRETERERERESEGGEGML